MRLFALTTAITIAAAPVGVTSCTSPGLVVSGPAAPPQYSGANYLPDRYFCWQPDCAPPEVYPVEYAPPGPQGHRQPRLSESVPTIDVRPICQAGAGGAIGLKKDMQACLEEEQNVRDEIAKQWTQFGADDRASCIRSTTMSGAATYTELLTCLELERDAHKLPD